MYNEIMTHAQRDRGENVNLEDKMIGWDYLLDEDGNRIFVSVK